MKKVLVLMLLVFGLLAGCGSVPPKVEVFKPGYTKAPIFVAPLSFEKFKRPAGWESDADWNKHVEAWQGRFSKWLHATNRDVRDYAEGTKIDSGLIITPFVVDIKRRYNGFGGLDGMDIVAELQEATGEKAATISYEAEMGAGMEGWTFGGRMGLCADNAGEILGREIKK